MKSYETLEHTADIGLRIRGKSLEKLFLNAASGLFFLITGADEIKSEEKLIQQDFYLEAESLEELFLKWMKELLFVFSAHHWIPVRFDFHKGVGAALVAALPKTGQAQGPPLHLQATGYGVTYDPTRHGQHYEVKAVTYHQFKFEKKSDGSFEAEVILDI